MANSARFPCPVVLIKHMRPLRRKHPDVIWMIILLVAVVMTDDLTRLERPPQLPLSDHLMLIISFFYPRVSAADVRIGEGIGHFNALGLVPSSSFRVLEQTKVD